MYFFKKGTLIKRAGVRTHWTPPGSAPGAFDTVRPAQEPREEEHFTVHCGTAGTLSMTPVTMVSRTAQRQFFDNTWKTTSEMMLTSTWSGG